MRQHGGVCHLSGLAGYRKAAFPAALLAVPLDDLWIDHDKGFILLLAHVDHDDSLEHTDLGRCKADAFRLIHRLFHIFNELPKLGRHLPHFLCSL